MTDLPPCRFATRTTSGHRVLVYFLRFNTHGPGLHRFTNHNHAKKFTGYLFSQSKRNSADEQTALNLISEYCDAGTLLRQEYNTDPPGFLADFLERRFPKGGAHRQLGDDGCYPLFLVRMNGGPALSNFVFRDEADGQIRVDHPHLGHLDDALDLRGGGLTDEEGAIRAFAGRDAVLPFEACEDRIERQRAESLVNAAVQKGMGVEEGRPLLSVVHRDQADHPFYHVHRLIAMA